MGVGRGFFLFFLFGGWGEGRGGGDDDDEEEDERKVGGGVRRLEVDDVGYVDMWICGYAGGDE